MKGVITLFRVMGVHKKKTGLIIVALLLGGCVFSALTNWGVRGKYYTNTEWEGKPYLVRRDNTVFLRGINGIRAVPTEAFSVKWQGWIVITEPGTYTFATKSDDGSYLSIDNTRVIDNGGAHGPQKVNGEIFLEKGTYRFEILYFTIGGGCFINTLWTPPNKAEEQLPAEVLYVKRPTTIGIFFRNGVTKWSPQLRILSLIVGLLLLFLIPLAMFFRIVKLSSKMLIFSGVLLLLVLVAVEVFAGVFFTLFQKHFTFFNPQQYLATQEQQEQMLHAQLSDDSFFEFGWNTNFSTPYGERPRSVSYDKPLLSAYGDSFTYCDEVEHNETWQTYLSNSLTMDVYNFGVGGYGTDQAYLKYLSVYPKIPTPIVLLGLTTENINRIVNVYRPFYFPRTAGRATKPRFMVKDGELVLLENPVRKKEDVKNLGDLHFIQRIGKYDWWYNRNNYPILQFPYTKILFNKRMWLEIFYGRANRKIDDIDPRPWADLWETEEAKELMFKIFDAFVNNAKERGAIPVIMVLPLRYQVELKFREHQHESKVTKILEYCESQDYVCFDSITPMAISVGTETEIDSLYHGHVSAKGNRIIAEAFREFLEENFSDVIGQFRQ